MSILLLCKTGYFDLFYIFNNMFIILVMEYDMSYGFALEIKTL